MKSRNTSILFVAAGTLLALSASTVLAQGGQPAGASDPAAHTQHQQHPPQPAGQKELVDQIAELRAQVARLDAALVQGHRQTQPMPMSPSMQQQPAQNGGMGGMGGMMGMMNQMMAGEMGGMGMGGMSGMNQPGASGGGMPMGPGGMSGSSMGMEKMMGMSKMGQMPMPSMMVSTLPGFPGASHIYHVGATGFFLDHPEHITLTTDQQTRLGQLREKALMEQASAERSIEQGEQELWTLTASDSPDATKIEAKVREIEKLRGDQRLAFIRAVGTAATVLTDDQRKQLTGMMPPDAAPAAAPPQQGGGMGGHM